jgi:hypothetical protein
MLLVTGAIADAAGTLRIIPLVRDKSVIVSVELADAYTPEVREVIASGLRTTFTYDVALMMVVPVWADRTIATAVISTSDHYDNLTRRHTLTRTIDGRVDEVLVTEDESVARSWLMNLRGLPLCPTSKLDPHRDYYVRISARVRPPGSSLLGLANAVTNQAKFTFIP